MGKTHIIAVAGKGGVGKTTTCGMMIDYLCKAGKGPLLVVDADTWGVKESIMPEADMPEWGSQEERGIEMEIVTAAAVLASGSDAVIMRHPEAIRTIAAMIGELV